MRVLPALAMAGLLLAAAPAQAAIWLPSKTPSNTLLRAVDFATPLDGFAVGGGKAIWRTVDGGLTWTQVMGGYFDTGWFDVEAVSSSEAWAVGVNAIFEASVAHTVDGGLTWEQRSFGVYADGGFHEANLQGVAISGGTVLAVAQLWYGVGAIVASTDGGQNWDTVLVTPRPLTAIDAEGPAVVAAGWSGLLYTSPDGGASWGAAPADGKLTFLAVDLVTPDTGFAATDAGVVLRTRDGGASWAALPAAPGTALGGIAFATPDDGIVVGHGGTVRSTSDGGLTWAAENAVTEADLLGAAALPAGPVLRLWAVGAGGVARHGLAA